MPRRKGHISGQEEETHLILNVLQEAGIRGHEEAACIAKPHQLIRIEA